MMDLPRTTELIRRGMADGLHEHEWREHGGCSGLDDDEYFRHALELARTVDAALGARLSTLAGEETTAAGLRETANLFHPGLGATLTFHCRVLRDAGETLHMSLDAQLLLYKVFERQVMERYGELVERLNVLLTHEGILPGLVYLPYRPRTQGQSRGCSGLR